MKLAVVGQQHALPRTVDQPGRCGEMTGQAPPFERIRIIEQLDEHGGERRLVLATPAVAGQLGAPAVGFALGFHPPSYVPAARERRQDNPSSTATSPLLRPPRAVPFAPHSLCVK